MTLRTEMTSTGRQFLIKCACGWESGLNYTAEGVGREFDLHMAKMYPLPTSRRPCPDPPRSTLRPEDVKTGQVWEGPRGTRLIVSYRSGGGAGASVSYQFAHLLGIAAQPRREMKVSALLRNWRLIGTVNDHDSEHAAEAQKAIHTRAERAKGNA